MDVTIREAGPSDVPGLDIVRRQAVEAMFSREFERDRFADLVAGPDPDLPDWIESEDHLVLVAETEVTPVTYVAADLASCEMVAVYTSPDYEREGFARAVHEEVVDRARGRGCETLSVDAPEPAIPFFEALGYERVGEATWEDLPGARLERSI